MGKSKKEDRATRMVQLVNLSLIKYNRPLPWATCRPVSRMGNLSTTKNKFAKANHAWQQR